MINLLRELRFVAPDVGGLDAAWRMPTEWRRWWIEEMKKEKEPFQDKSRDGRTVTRDVPRGPRGA